MELGNKSWPVGEKRPEQRSDCLPGGPNEMRPCPWVSCRYHLAVHVNKQTGRLLLVPDWDDGRISCALDVADTGPATLEEIGNLSGVTRERVRQLEALAIHRNGIKMRSEKSDLLDSLREMAALRDEREAGREEGGDV